VAWQADSADKETPVIEQVVLVTVGAAGLAWLAAVAWLLWRPTVSDVERRRRLDDAHRIIDRHALVKVASGNVENLPTDFKPADTILGDLGRSVGVDARVLMATATRLDVRLHDGRPDWVHLRFDAPCPVVEVVGSVRSPEIRWRTVRELEHVRLNRQWSGDCP